MAKVSNYQELKARARNKAIDFQFCGLSYEGLMIAQNYFYRLGKRYGLLQEFRDNGVL